MKIITIFNYPDQENYNLMCQYWVELTAKYCNSNKVEIFTSDPNSIHSTIISKIDALSNFKLVKKEFSPHIFNIPNIPLTNKSRHNIFFKLYNLCQETEPFIFIDADAYLLQNVDYLVKRSIEKPIIFINHQKIKGHTDTINIDFLNSGVIVCSNPSILNFNSITNVNKFSKFYNVPGTDQCLLFNYLTNINYDYVHPEIGKEWNACARYVETSIQDNKMQSITKNLMEIDENNKQVGIIHYWYKYKPWLINCPIFNKLNNRVKIYIPDPKILSGIYKSKDTTLWQLIDAWADLFLVEKIYVKNTTHIWLNNIGDTLLYERPTLLWFKNPQYKLALFGNPELPKNNKHNKHWIFWGRHPKILQKYYEKPSLSYSERKYNSCFIGKVENNVQEKHRVKYDWSQAIELFEMPLYGEYKYNQEEYLDILGNSKFGLCLRGFGPKCNREVELLASGTVLLVPPDVDVNNYYEPLVENVHYLKVNHPKDVKYVIENCTKEKWTEMSKNCREWYNRNCSIEGSFKTTLKIIQEDI